MHFRTNLGGTFICKLSKCVHLKRYKYLGTDCFLDPYQGTYDIDISLHKHSRREIGLSGERFGHSIGRFFAAIAVDKHENGQIDHRKNATDNENRIPDDA